MAKPAYWPETLSTSGFPFLLQGWNDAYQLTGLDEDGFPIYELPSYTLYGCIDIIGCTIRYDKTRSKWTFTRDCDGGPYLFKKTNQGTPFGSWGNNGGINIFAHAGVPSFLSWISGRLGNSFSAMALAGGLVAAGWYLRGVR